MLSVTGRWAMFGVPSSTCLLHMLLLTPSDYLNIFELAQVIDWHMTFYDKSMWEGPNDESFPTGVSVYLLEN